MKAALLNSVSAVALHVAMPLNERERLKIELYQPFSPRWFRFHMGASDTPPGRRPDAPLSAMAGAP